MECLAILVLSFGTHLSPISTGPRNKNMPASVTKREQYANDHKAPMITCDASLSGRSYTSCGQCWRLLKLTVC